jgi:hypothetical protein
MALPQRAKLMPKLLQKEAGKKLKAYIFLLCLREALFAEYYCHHLTPH